MPRNRQIPDEAYDAVREAQKAEEESRKQELGEFAKPVKKRGRPKKEKKS